MKKIAIFVEGQTEQLFIQKLLIEIFGHKKIAYDIIQCRGGNKSAITFCTIEASSITDETKYYFLIYECGGDSKIKSYVLDQRVSLIKSGYKKIIGIL